MSEPTQHDAPAARPGPPKRLRYRVPVRIRHNWRLLALTAAVLLTLTVVAGTVRVHAYVTSEDRTSETVVTEDVQGTVDVFDASTAHTVELSYSQADYDRMVEAFFEEGEKEYIEADVIIDGTLVPSVGIRLKGNSTLQGLTNADGETRSLGAEGGMGMGGAPEGMELPEGMEPPQGMQAPEGQQAPADTDVQAGQEEQEGGQRQGPGGGMGGMVTLSTESPEDLPWLIRFDEFVEGRVYQGHRELAVRPATGSSEYALNEALALEVTAAADVPTQDHAYSSFTVNGGEAATRLILEHPDEYYTDESLDGEGVLYKALSGGSFSDQGDDPTDYESSFKQVNLKGSQDLQPVIDLVRFVADADDEEFAAGLPDRLDVDSFARYLAVQNLILNGDAIDGPGVNYYLWYDLDEERFTVVSWDLNLSFSGSADQGSGDEATLGGMGGPGGQEAEGGAPQLPEGVEPPEGFDAGQAPGAAGGGQGGGGPGGGNALKERFMATPEFEELYERAYAELYREVYADGTALELVDAEVEALALVDGVDAEALAADADELRALVARRTEALATDEAVTANTES